MEKENSKKRYRPAAVTINKDIFVGILDFLKGLTLSVSVLDPANMNGTEVYEFTMPPDTAPGSRFRLKRSAPFDTGFVIVRVKARPDARYKVRGFDVRCELKISTQRATLGGSESVRGVLGNIIRIHIPPHVARGEIISVPGEGMPKARGGRGDLLVRITYRPIVQISRTLNPRSLSRARLKATNA
jgi:DnaJ-class molecular chaperone